MIRLTKPIPIKITGGNGLYCAENKDYFVFSCGATPEEATANLQIHIIKFYRQFKAMKDSELTDDCILLKRRYLALFEGR